MRQADVSAFSQIGYTAQFVDPEVEHIVRTFHHHCLSCAGSVLDLRVSMPYLFPENMLLVEGKEARFSHISKVVPGDASAKAEVARWPSLRKGAAGSVEFTTVSSILAEALGADAQGRRPYPSGGALYTVETLVLTSDRVVGAEPFAVYHYLPASNSFEIIPSTMDDTRYVEISSIQGVVFYIAYFVNLKKSLFKYRSRGYLLSVMEAGSMYQNVLGVAQAHGLGSCVVAGFSDYTLSKLCGVDSRLLLPVVIQSFGIPGV